MKYKPPQVAVRNKIRGLYDEFCRLLNTHQSKRTEKWQQENLAPFLTKMHQCLDISCKDPAVLKRLEEHYRVKMSTMEEDFLADQLGDSKMICTTDVDR